MRVWLFGLAGCAAFIALHAACLGLGYWLWGSDGEVLVILPECLAFGALLVYLVGEMVEACLEARSFKRRWQR